MFDWLYPYADKLRFPDEILENQFRKEYLANTISTTRLALVLGLILYSLFGFLDIYAVPVSKDIVWIIRYGIVAPIIILALIASYAKSLQQYTQRLMCICFSYFIVLCFNHSPFTCLLQMAIITNTIYSI